MAIAIRKPDEIASSKSWRDRWKNTSISPKYYQTRHDA